LSALVGGRAQAGAQLVDGEGASAGGGRWEAEARVSLEDPAVRDPLRAWRRAPASVDAVRALGAALRDRARVDVRRYARQASSDSDGGSLGFGPRVGVELQRSRERTRLVSAVTRPPGGLWERRVDCVAAT
jgi:hypothetical protein